MEATIKTFPEKKLVGKRLRMSLAGNRTFELWQSFMKRRKEITNNVGTDLYSVQVYDAAAELKDMNANAFFDKWAAIEVLDFESVPHDMECLTLTGGMYAVFIHKGAASRGAETFGYIFGTWLPSSDFLLDNSRAHFEILGKKYKNDDPVSEEEVWIPVKKKE